MVAPDGWSSGRLRSSPGPVVAAGEVRTDRSGGRASLRSAVGLLAGLTFVLTGVSCAGPRPEVQLDGATMGTVWRVHASASSEHADALAALIRAELDAVDRAMSTWRPDSELSRFNYLSAGESAAFSDSTWSVLELAWRVRADSGGAFDPTVGPLVDAWGFGAAARSEAPPPSPERLARLRQTVGAVELVPARQGATKLHDDAALDLSAIAKGWAVDRVSDALREAGFDDHLVEVGGEVRTSGTHPSGTPWRIAIERPPSAPAGDASAGRDDHLPPGLQRVLEMTDGALATSGDYRNFRELNGVRHSHTFDPRTGAPVRHSLASASVLGENCAVADAQATALMVLGPDEGERWATENGIAALLLVHGEHGLEERMTAAFREALDHR